MPWDLRNYIEPARPSDPFRDYCQWPYDAPEAPGADAWRGSALLYHSFEMAGVGPEMAALCAALRRNPGLFNTVWGIKFAEDVISWEFYFYDYAGLTRRFDTRGFADVARPYLDIQVPAVDDRPYFMFSVEIGPEHIKRRTPVSQIDLYIGNPGSSVSSGLCYGLTSQGLELRNNYYFFNASQHAREISEKIQVNAHLSPTRLNLDDILWPEIKQVQTIVVANKRRNDGLYFSRIPVNHLLTCLEKLDAPEPLRHFASVNQSRLRHLLFDVGYDYSASADGHVRYTKGSYYGLL